jgi:molecular chaperone DnaK (HSP70)
MTGTGAAPGGARASCALGIGVDGGRTVVLIREGAPVPARGRMLFTTVADGQPAVEIPVVRVSGRPAQAFPIGRFVLSGFAVGLRGAPRIEVGLAIDDRGILHAHARDPQSGACQEVTFARGLHPGMNGKAAARRAS